MVLGLFVTTMSLAGVVSGPLVRRIGSKASAGLAHLLQAAGVAVFFFSDGVLNLSLAAVALGLSFQLNSHAHIGIALLFPSARATILTCFAVCSDASTLIFIALERLSRQVGVAIMTWLFLAAIGLLAALDLVVTPRRFEPVSLDRETDVKPLSRRQRMPASRQMLTSPFWLLLLYFVFNFTRSRKFFAPNLRDILREFYPDDDVNFYVELYNWGNALSFAPAILLGLIAEAWGAAAMLMIHSICGLALVLTPLFPDPRVHVVGVGFFSVTCYSFAMVNVFLTEYYGFETITVLSGVVSSTNGILALLYDLTWPAAFADLFDRTFRWPLLIHVAVSLGALVIPIALLILDGRPEKSVELPREVFSETEEVELPLLRHNWP